MTDSQKSTSPRGGKNLLEWVVFGLSLLLVVTMLGVLAVEAAGWQERPAELSVKLAPPEIHDGVVTAVVEVTNHGDVAASEVKVDIVRVVEDRDQQAGILLDFVPRHGTRRGRVSFPDASEPGDIKVLGMGFADP